MTQFKQNKGSSRSVFPTFNGIWNQNHVNWLVEKFGSSSGEINEIKAINVRKKGSSDIPNCKYRELLELAVKQGLAYSNGKPVNHNKYAIYFNSRNSLSNTEKLFDKELLLHPRIVDLPPRFDRNYILTARELHCWVVVKTHYTYVYQLICGLQEEEKVNLKILPSWFPSHLLKSLEIEVREYICIYKALKFGWSEIQEEFILNGRNYNDFFLDILQDRSFTCFTLNFIDLKNDRPRSQYEDLRSLWRWSPLSDGQPLSETEKLKMFGKYFGKKHDILLSLAAGDGYQWHRNCLKLEAILAASNDPFLRQILADWQEIDKEFEDAYLSWVSLLKDKPRHAKYQEKVRKNRADYFKKRGFGF